MSDTMVLPPWIDVRPYDRADDFGDVLAPLIHAWARTDCRDAPEGPGCRDYHGLWPYLRLAGRNAGIGADAPVFAAAFRGLSERDELGRVLICGAADHMMLALLADALEGHAWPDVTILDLCPTPLRANRWFSERRGRPITTIQADALHHTPERRYDLVTSHFFLNFFDGAGRDRLAAAWFAALAPGGRVVISNRVWPEGRRTDDEAVERRRAGYAAALARARNEGHGVDATPEMLAAAVERLAASRRFGGIRSVGALAAAFTTAGFEIEVLTPIDGGRGGSIDPGLGSHLLVARRPAG